MFRIDTLRKISFHLLLAAANTATAAAADAIRVQETHAVAGEAPDGAKAATHDLRLQLHTFRGSHWGAGDAVHSGLGSRARALPVRDRLCRRRGAAGGGARALPQLLIAGGARPVRAMTSTKPAVFFVERIGDEPAQTSEAVVRASSNGRPELADTVWLAYGEYDAVLTLAHELVHVLADSSEHTSEAGNLMNGDYSPANTRLTPAQCEQVRGRGEANGLLKRR